MTSLLKYQYEVSRGQLVISPVCIPIIKRYCKFQKAVLEHKIWFFTALKIKLVLPVL